MRHKCHEYDAVHFFFIFIFEYFYLLLLRIRQMTPKTEFRCVFFFAHRSKMRKQPMKWCSRIHTSSQNLCIFIFSFNFVVICNFGRVFFLHSFSRTHIIIYLYFGPRDETKRCRWVFSPLIIIEKEIYELDILFMRIYSLYSLLQKKAFKPYCYCYYLFACNSLLLVPFFFVLPFCCLFTFRFISTMHFCLRFFSSNGRTQWITMVISKWQKYTLWSVCVHAMVFTCFECVVLCFFRWF